MANQYVVTLLNFYLTFFKGKSHMEKIYMKERWKKVKMEKIYMKERWEKVRKQNIFSERLVLFLFSIGLL